MVEIDEIEQVTHGYPMECLLYLSDKTKKCVTCHTKHEFELLQEAMFKAVSINFDRKNNSDWLDCWHPAIGQLRLPAFKPAW